MSPKKPTQAGDGRRDMPAAWQRQAARQRIQAQLGQPVKRRTAQPTADAIAAARKRVDQAQQAKAQRRSR